jgi:Zn-dependent protease
MLRFSLFGIPVVVQPFFWLVAAMLGGANHADSRDGLIRLILFIAVAFVSILVHELGHAIAGRRAGGGHATIELNAFGGLATHHGGRFTRNGHLARIAWGPGAGFLLFIATYLALVLILSPQDAKAMAQITLFNTGSLSETLHLLAFIREQQYWFEIASALLWVNFWWTLINLLPVMPLDGGQIAGTFIQNRHKLHLIGLITAAAMVATSLFLDRTLTAAVFGFLAWQNYQQMRQFRWQT